MDALTDLVPSPLALNTPPLAPGDHIRTHRDAFLAHRRAGSFREIEPRLGVAVPWVLVSCCCLDATIEGIVVGGDWDEDLKQWCFGDTFTVFDACDKDDGSFTDVHGWMFGKDDIEVLGELAGDAP